MATVSIVAAIVNSIVNGKREAKTWYVGRPFAQFEYPQSPWNTSCNQNQY